MKKIFLLVMGIILIGGIASAQINIGGGVSAILGTELYLYNIAGDKTEQYNDLLAVGVNAHIDVGAPLAFFIDATVGIALESSETYYENSVYIISYPSTVDTLMDNFVLSGMIGAGINLQLGQFDLFAGVGPHIYMYTWHNIGTAPNDLVTFGAAAMANAIFDMGGGLSVYGGASVAYDFYHTNAPHFDVIKDTTDPDVAFGVLVVTASAGVSVKY